MDKLSVIGKIGTILSDLQEQQEYFEKNLESLNEVEVELFAASANYLAEYAKVLKKFPVSRKAMAALPAPANTPGSADEDDDIGFRLSFEENEQFEEDDKKIHQPNAAGKQKLHVKEEPLAETLRKAAEERADEPDAQQPPAAGNTITWQEQPRRSTTDTSREAIAEAFLDPEPAAQEPEESPAGQPPGKAAPHSAEGPAVHSSEKPFSSASEKPASPAREKADPEVFQQESAAPEQPTVPQPRTPQPHTPGAQYPAQQQSAPLREPAAPSHDPAAPSREPAAQSQEPAASQQSGPSQEPASTQQSGPVQEPAFPSSRQDLSINPSEEKGNRKLSLNERFGEKKSTLYERIVPKQPEQGAGAPILNLGLSIGINERYYFIKNLFHDDKVAFDQAITRIDMCHSLGEALEYTNRSLAGKYSWSRKEEDARKFYDLLKRRFI
ncbi:hypothetical protein EDD80_101477 [Anseongella ginsenosidimutans]|uniref:Uncharacterized protein n=1 Tax=Anseongella ginsenosidimutans TaxID=496056 RepID=A0A4R3KWU2_9SPHI|nr:hypothetical protein [Anseongella ginsenosidimutans]QEC51065.1 hypothetical protein FRZ59_00995 [Anseongella ginsenosidimutans]TCS90277.1 hypothetical protein EDD80_101477 [Anseongella ginsenosidimutans]